METVWIKEKQLATAIERNEAYWHGELEEYPLLWITAPNGQPARPIPEPAQEMDLWIDTDYVMETAEDRLARTHYVADALPVQMPWLGPDQFAAWLGADLNFKPREHNTSWVAPFVDDWDNFPELRIDPENRWWKLYLEQLRRSAEQGKGKWVTAYPDLHNGIDALSAIRGGERLNMDLILNPEAIHRAMGQLTQVARDVVDVTSEIILGSGQGTSNWTLGYSAKKFFCIGQNDFSCMISPQMFREFCWDDTKSLCDSVDYSLYHLDGPGAIRHLPTLYELENLHAIQWVPGAGSDAAERWIDLLKSIQAAGRGVSMIGVTPEDAVLLCRELDCRNLFIVVFARSTREADDLFKACRQASAEQRGTTVALRISPYDNDAYTPNRKGDSMTHSSTDFHPVRLSLADLLGKEYVRAVCEGRALLAGEDASELESLAAEPIDFFPEAFRDRLAQLLPRVGQQVCNGLASSPHGASTEQFNAHAKTAMAPLSALGYYRLGEDGRVYLITKSEHYHAPLGHAFPGYRLIELARRLGIPNATHNNTRGVIVRKLEEELIREANGLAPDDDAGLQAVLDSQAPDTINRVLNLETGSLAAEAALKMILARFYRSQDSMTPPKYQGRVPVVLVMGDDKHGPHGNYHGTTVLTQVMRGMWPEMAGALAQGIFRVCPVRPDSLDDLEKAFVEYETGKFKIAGFFHEIVMMNYGGRLLAPRFLTRAYELCRQHDVPVVVDEIQTGIWSHELFMYREYGLRPSFVAVGKGFPGGEYPASRLLFSAAYDCLAQFGALVTNGQEELASLAYLITMRWARANAEVTRDVGDEYESRLRELASRYPTVVAAVEGRRHLAVLRFREISDATALVRRCVAWGLDISAQTYKEDCLPAVLTKLPLIAGADVVDLVLDRFEQALDEVAREAEAERTALMDTTAARR